MIVRQRSSKFCSSSATVWRCPPAQLQIGNVGHIVSGRSYLKRDDNDVTNHTPAYVRSVFRRTRDTPYSFEGQDRVGTPPRYFRDVRSFVLAIAAQASSDLLLSAVLRHPGNRQAESQ